MQDCSLSALIVADQGEAAPIQTASMQIGFRTKPVSQSTGGLCTFHVISPFESIHASTATGSQKQDAALFQRSCGNDALFKVTFLHWKCRSQPFHKSFSLLALFFNTARLPLSHRDYLTQWEIIVTPHFCSLRPGAAELHNST